MQASQLGFFAGWVAAALIGGALLAFGWQRLWLSYSRRRAKPD
jgi:hypothetical protein